MVKKLVILIIVIAFSASFAFAEQKKRSRFGFWKNLRGKIQGITPRKKSSITTAVGGVRGAKDDSAAELYWKGKEKELSVDSVELDKFNGALELAMEGETDKSIMEFEEFINQFPESPLRPDAVSALEALQNPPKEEVAAPVADETPATETPEPTAESPPAMDAEPAVEAAPEAEAAPAVEAEPAK